MQDSQELDSNKEILTIKTDNGVGMIRRDNPLLHKALEKEAEKYKPMEESVKEPEQLKMGIDHPDFLRPERLEGETRYQYKLRQWIQKAYIKQRSKGTFMWISKDMKMPVYSKEDQELMKTMTPDEKSKVKPIAFTISKGFTYNKAQVKKAMDAYLKKKEDQEILAKLEETNQIKITK